MMDICCSKCGVKETIDASPVSNYTIKQGATQAGRYVTLSNQLYCPDCGLELRGVRET